MVDYNELRRKFKPKKPIPAKKSKQAIVKAIAREYEMKKAALTGGAPAFRKGPVFYLFIIVILVIVGSMVLTALDSGVGFGKKRIERKPLQARKAMDSLSVALGRFKFHVGVYPSTEDGLKVLAARKPDEIRKARAKYKGWDGPYVNHIVNDPWGHEYVYETRPEGGHPVLYSHGPNGRAGDDDDVLPDQLSFEAAFQDTSWTNNWAPAELRGIVVAPDEATKKIIEEEMKQYDK